jgi:hypothetical protein
MQLRICFLNGSQLFGHDVDQEGYARKLAGPLTPYIRALLGLDVLKRHNVSLLFQAQKRIGSEITGDSSSGNTGCLHALQQDRADVIAHIQSLPVPGGGYNLTYGPAISQYEGSLVSSYKPSSNLISPDLLDHLSIMPITVYAVILFTVLLAISFSKSWVTGRTNNPVKVLSKIAWMIVCFIVGNYHTNTRIRKIRMLFAALILTIAVYRVQTNLVIRTEQVVATPAVKLKTLSDLLDANVPVVFTSGLEFEIFSRSSNLLVKQVFNTSMRNKGSSNVLVDFDFGLTKEKLVHLINGLHQQKLAIIRQNPISLLALFCFLSPRVGITIRDNIMIMNKLPESPHPLGGIVMSQHMMRRKKELARLMTRSIRISTAESMLLAKTTAIMNDEYNRRLRKRPVRGKAVIDCFMRIGDRKPGINLVFLTVRSMRSLLIMFAVSVCTALALILIEFRLISATKTKTVTLIMLAKCIKTTLSMVRGQLYYKFHSVYSKFRSNL